MAGRIFVFGSNLLGQHGRGAALDARMLYGAEYGIGVGRTGNSYAIPTKATPRESLPLIEIAKHVSNFLQYATDNPDLTFEVTRVGCGLAGYKDDQIAPMFTSAPSNCSLPEGWRDYIRSSVKKDSEIMPGHEDCRECLMDRIGE